MICAAPLALPALLSPIGVKRKRKGERLVRPRGGPGGLCGQNLETFTISHGSRGGPGAEGTAVLEANGMVVGPWGVDYRRGT